MINILDSMFFLKKILYLLLPQKAFTYIKHKYWTFLQHKKRYDLKRFIRVVRKKQAKAVKAINPQEITCVFLATFEQTWKYDYLYLKMEKDDRFNPIVVVCPIVNYGRENMLQHLRDATSFFQNKGYKVLCSYNEANDTYIDIRGELNPDVIFYTNPYKGLIDDRYYINNFLDKLTVYVPYAFNNNSDISFTYDLPFHNLLWRHYIESKEHLNYVRELTICKGDNAKCVGYPGIEGLLIKRNPSDDSWKIKDKDMKRIIWAPHHTIYNEGSVVYSCFLRYCETMLNIADKYKNKIQIVFKPHPVLKNKLYELWGKEKTDDYYKQWKLRENTAMHNGDYIDLFLTSDAMIHDSGSFIAEYLYVNKPAMRTMNDVCPEKMYNSFAIDCLKQYYKAYSEQDIEQFIINVINDLDPLKEQRTKFVNDVLMPKDGMPSQNIIKDILDSIDNQILYRN